MSQSRFYFLVSHGILLLYQMDTVHLISTLNPMEEKQRFWLNIKGMKTTKQPDNPAIQNVVLFLNSRSSDHASRDIHHS